MPEVPGVHGRDGVKGDQGPKRPEGPKGEQGAQAPQKNWKQCAWKNINENKDNGLIKVKGAYHVKGKQPQEKANRFAEPVTI